MKKLSYLLILSSFTSMAQLAQLPDCNSLEVRLSKKPVACRGQIPEDIIFDIPEQKLNIEDLEKLFQGAESSGGRLVSPMAQPRIQEDLTPFPFSLQCHASLISDGGKKVSFLSKRAFTLNQSQYNSYLTPDTWKHFLIEGNQFDSSVLTPLDISPAVTLPYFKVSMTYNEEAQRFGYEVCESRSTLTGQALNCALGESPISAEETPSVIFNKKVQEGNTSVSFTLKVKCHRY